MRSALATDSYSSTTTQRGRAELQRALESLVRDGPLQQHLPWSVRMRTLALLFSLTVLLVGTLAEARGRGGAVRVRSHVRSSGSYVPTHSRTSRDASFRNNWSTVGNVNPTTGAAGTRWHR